MEELENKDGKLNIELTEEIADGIYSNLVIISHSNTEFVLDFVKVMPGMPKAKVKSRVLMTPQHAKRLKKALEDNILKFEAQNGNIKEIENVSFPLNFGRPAGEA